MLRRNQSDFHSHRGLNNCTHTCTHTSFLKSFILNWALTKVSDRIEWVEKQLWAVDRLIQFIKSWCASFVLAPCWVLGIHCRGCWHDLYSRGPYRLVLEGNYWEGRPSLPVSCYFCFSCSLFYFWMNSSNVEETVLRGTETHLFKEAFCNEGFHLFSPYRLSTKVIL